MPPSSIHPAVHRHVRGSKLGAFTNKNAYQSFHTVFPPHRWPLQVIDRDLEKTLVIEDDVRFEHQFKKKLMKLMDDIDKAQLDWELM